MYANVSRRFHTWERFLCMDQVAKRKQRCIIVGGGVAGIAAAVEAALQGMEVVLIEGRRYLGGRARSFIDEATGDVLDNGQHVAMGCYHSLRRVLSELGTESLLAPGHPVPIAFRSPDGEEDCFNPYRLPGSLGVLRGLLSLRSFTLAERMRLIGGGIRLAAARGWNGETVSTVLRRYGQTERLIQRFWEPLVLAALNAPIEHADPELLRIVLRRAFGGGGESHYLLVPRAGLSELWEPLPTWLAARGGEIRLGTRAEELVMFDDRVIGVTTSDGEEIRGSSVIVAVPPVALQRLVPPTLQHHIGTIETFETMPIVSVYLWLDRRVEMPPMLGLWGTVAQWVFDRTAFVERSPVARERYPGFVEVTISAARHIAAHPAEQIAEQVTSELQSVLGSLSVLHWRVIKERAATVLLTPKMAQLRHPSRSGIAGLYVAGDWTATGLPATLEGAAFSGIAAARAAAQDSPPYQRLR
jgi:squalene-associated FAD-dependent desaturase